MKILFQIITLFFCLNSFGQKSADIKISKEKLNAAKTIQDIITLIPKDCKISSFILSAKTGGNLKEFVCSGEILSPESKSNLDLKNKGEWFFIERIKSGCSKSHKENYKIIIF